MSAFQWIWSVIALLFAGVGVQIIRIVYDTYKSRRVLLLKYKPQGTPLLPNMFPKWDIQFLVNGRRIKNAYKFDIEVKNAGNHDIQGPWVRVTFDDEARIVGKEVTKLTSQEITLEQDTTITKPYIKRFRISLLHPKDTVGVAFLTTHNKENLVDVDSRPPGVKVIKLTEEETKPRFAQWATTVLLSLLLSAFAVYGFWISGKEVKKQAEITKTQERSIETLDEILQSFGDYHSIVSVIASVGGDTVKMGTGLSVNNKGDIITTKHVISGGSEIFVVRSEDDALFRAMVVDSFGTHDLALLRVPALEFSKKSSSAVFADSASILVPGQEVEVTSLDAATRKTVHQIGRIYDVYSDSIIVSLTNSVSRTPYSLAGTSGSPVFFRGSTVTVGMVVSLTITSATVGYKGYTEIHRSPPRLHAIPVEHIKDFLKKNGVPYQEAHFDPLKGPSSSYELSRVLGSTNSSRY